jgi:hypothetical protein
MAAAAASSSSAAAASSTHTLRWTQSIPTSGASTSNDIEKIKQRFGVSLPKQLESMILEHAGEQISPSAFLAQNVQTGLWMRERMGPLYPVLPMAGDSEDDGSYPHLSQVNEMFIDELLEADEDSDQPPVSRKKHKGDAAAAAAAASSTSSNASASTRSGKSSSVPFFAFAESPSGRVLALETSSQAVMLLDLTGRRGPWIAGETFEDFILRITQGGSQPYAEGESEKGELEYEPEDDMDDDMGVGDDDGEEELYACDVCMDELPPSQIRYHCDSCPCYDLCEKCMAKAAKLSASSSDAAAASAGSASKKSRSAASISSSHPSSHTFSKIEASHDVEEEEEEKESAPKKGSHKKK